MRENERYVDLVISLIPGALYLTNSAEYVSRVSVVPRNNGLKSYMTLQHLN